MKLLMATRRLLMGTMRMRATHCDVKGPFCSGACYCCQTC